MAKDPEPRKKSRREALYDSESSVKSRGASEKKPGGTERKMPEAAPKASDNGMMERHKTERAEIGRRHENERRDQHGEHRDQHRAMDKRHVEERGAVTDHASMVGMHRRHEHEKSQMHEEHHHQHRAMRAKHERELHDVHMKQEAEMAGAGNAADMEGGAPPGAAAPAAPAAPAPVAQAA